MSLDVTRWRERATASAVDPRGFALLFVPGPVREPLAAVWMLDRALGRIVATAREPLLGQLRLGWWRERLENLEREPQSEPVLARLKTALSGHDVTVRALAPLVDGWERLLADPLNRDALSAYARDRGETLFGISANLLGGQAPSGFGSGWALADFARHCSIPAVADLALEMARASPAGEIPRRLKPLRILVRLGRSTALPGSPIRRRDLLRALL